MSLAFCCWLSPLRGKWLRAGSSRAVGGAITLTAVLHRKAGIPRLISRPPRPHKPTGLSKRRTVAHLMQSLHSPRPQTSMVTGTVQHDPCLPANFSRDGLEIQPCCRPSETDPKDVVFASG